MKPRQVPTLAQLAPAAFYEEVAAGLLLLQEHIGRIDEAAASLEAEERNRSAQVLRALEAEEAGKFLVLIDAVRCDRKAFASEFGRQLKRFSKHVPRGIQAAVCEIRPASYSELLGYIDSILRPQYYLDGPNDVDWIFRNPVQADREEAFYVDYVERDDGSRHWISPNDIVVGSSPIALDVAAALTRIGATSERGLAVLASEWQGFVPEPAVPYGDLVTKIQETVVALREDGIGDAGAEDEDLLVDLWPFPLYLADIDEPIDVDPEDLIRRRQDWFARMVGH